MATQQPSGGIDRCAYDATIRPRPIIDSFPHLIAALKSTTPGSRNTLLHLAANERNIACIKELLRLNPLLVKATNAQGNTALHLAAQRGCSEVVKVLLQQKESGADVRNKLGETALFKAYESGDLDTVKALFDAYPPSLGQRTVHGRTCLYVAIIKGHTDLVKHILDSSVAKELMQEKYKDGDTALHAATGRNYVHIMSQLINFDAQLCYTVNNSQETPICMAAKLGHLAAVKELIKWRPDAVEIRNSCGMNVLHIAAQLSQVRIVDYLNKTVCLSDMVNQGLEKPPYINNHTVEGQEPCSMSGNLVSGRNKAVHIAVSCKQEAEKPQIAINCPCSKIEGLESGDTPLHIAARNKNFHMVESLLHIQGLNKDAVNEEGLTALDIARGNTEYHESHNIIAKLSNYPHKRRHFLYNFPNVSSQKYENAIKLVNKAYEDRRNSELVVAVLLATMSFTAAFTIPGGFETEVGNGETQKMLGSPLLIGFVSFKVFLIFDCLAFFLSLFVVLMWHLSTPLTTGNKALFLCVTTMLVCSSFGFTALAFIAALYTMLAHKINTLACLVLGFCTVICGCGFVLLLYLNTKFTVKMARFKHLHGVIPLVHDRLVEYLWMKLEGLGCVDLLRKGKSKWDTILCSNCYRKARAKPKCCSAENV